MGGDWGGNGEQGHSRRDNTLMTHTFAPDRYENAAFRRCGDSGLMLPLISLGF